MNQKSLPASGRNLSFEVDRLAPVHGPDAVYLGDWCGKAKVTGFVFACFYPQLLRIIGFPDGMS